MNRKRSGTSILEVLIAMVIFVIALALVFIIPRSIVDYAKEVDVKMDLYQVAMNEAEKLVSSRNNATDTRVFLNGATYTGKIEKISLAASRILVVSSKTNEVDSIEPIEDIQYASITFQDEKKDYSVSFNIIPKQ